MIQVSLSVSFSYLKHSRTTLSWSITYLWLVKQLKINALTPNLYMHMLRTESAISLTSKPLSLNLIKLMCKNVVTDALMIIYI
jgi:hypothetical protein